MLDKNDEAIIFRAILKAVAVVYVVITLLELALGAVFGWI